MPQQKQKQTRVHSPVIMLCVALRCVVCDGIGIGVGDPAGPSKWEDLGNPAVGVGPEGCDPECQTTATTFNSQSTFVLPLTTATTTTTEDEATTTEGQGEGEAAVALWMGDRWYPTATYPKEPRPLLQVIQKTRPFVPFCTQKILFYQDRLGTNIGKTQQKRPFLTA
jgi:hypothetical protein